MAILLFVLAASVVSASGESAAAQPNRQLSEAVAPPSPPSDPSIVAQITEAAQWVNDTLVPFVTPYICKYEGYVFLKGFLDSLQPCLEDSLDGLYKCPSSCLTMLRNVVGYDRLACTDTPTPVTPLITGATNAMDYCSKLNDYKGKVETARAIAEWIRADTGQEACDAVEDLLVSLGVPDAGVDILMDIGCPRIKLSYASRA